MAAHQFQLFAPAPTPTAFGTFAMDFDPTIYGPTSRYTVFSATGDAIAYANVSDRHIDVHYSSLSSGIGQLPGLPILTIDLPLLAPPAGQPDVDSVTPLSATSLRVDGVNFTAGMPVTIDGAAVASVDFVNTTQLNVTLAAATELTGKHLHAGSADYFIAASSGSGALQFVPALTTFTSASVINHQFEHGGFTEIVALLNPGFAPVTAVLQSQPGFHGPTQIVTIQPGELQAVDVGGFASVPNIQVDCSAPIRILSFAHRAAIGPNGESFFFESPQPPLFPAPIQLALSQTAVSWSWQTGTPAPAPVTATVNGNLPFTVALSSASWLAIATSASSITLLPKVTGLAPGTYHTTVAAAPDLPGFTTQPTNIDVSLTVSTSPLISAAGSCCAFFEPVVNMPATGPLTLNIASNGTPVPITAVASGAPWLSVTPDHATTPATLTVTAAPQGLNLPAGTYQATLTVQGPSNTLTFPVSLMVFGSPPPQGSTLQVTPSSLAFALEPGSVSDTRLVSVSPIGVVISVSSDSPWLATSVEANGPVPAAINVSASAANLAAGTYTGHVTVASATLGSIVVPVRLTVVAAPAPQTKLTVTPSTLTFAGDVTQTPTQTISVDSGGTPVLVKLATQSTSSVLFVRPVVHSAYQSPDQSQFLTPATIDVSAGASTPGTYHAALVFTGSNGLSATVPTTLTAAPSSTTPPVIANIVNGASLLAGPLAPGEIFSVFGMALGPGSQLLVNGTAAEVIYALPGQLNAIVPANFDPSHPATLEVDLPAAKSIPWGLPAAAAAPAVFTLNGSGVGPAAVLNADSSINTPSNPAARGSIVAIYTTGGIPEKVSIGGLDCALTFSGPAPASVRGLFQVNAVVPASAPAGNAVPVVITIGNSQSLSAATIAVN
jgi:uncharacterized protein (TIGR03437 family)